MLLYFAIFLLLLGRVLGLAELRSCETLGLARQVLGRGLGLDPAAASPLYIQRRPAGMVGHIEEYSINIPNKQQKYNKNLNLFVRFVI